MKMDNSYLFPGGGRSKHLLVGVSMLLLALALVACGGQQEPTATAAAEQPTELATEAPTEEATATAEPTEAATATAEPTMAGPTPAVSVEDQELVDGTVTVSLVTAAQPGWIVIHADDNGAPGPVIGHAAVDTGDNENVTVEVDESGVTETLYAMLHVDNGTVGTYEFPDGDPPVSVDGNVVVQPFTITGGMMSAMNEVGLQLVADGLAAPIAYAPIPDGSGRYVVVDQVGVVYLLDADGTMLEQPFLDVRDRMVELDTSYDERGLLGLAFHPNFADNGRFFVYYSAPLRDSAPAGWNATSHVSAFQVSADDPNIADPASEQILLQVDEPQGNHNAGQIAFGPDGYLYIPLGDGGAANDVAEGHVSDWYDFNEGGNGQDISQNLLGSILRIDIDGEGANGEAYAIPGDNPFVGMEDVLPEIWAYGFRNPFRISFDQGGDHALFVGDAGQNRWEEVSMVEAGGNYGWNVKEGTHCFDAANPDDSLDECPDADPEGNPLIDPIIEYQNANQEGGIGLVVIGGVVYRGDTMPNMDGVYIFGDWSNSFQQPNGRLFWAMPGDGDGMWAMQNLNVSNTENGTLNSFLLSFGQDANGEVYILTSDTPGPSGDTGRVYRLVPPAEADAMMGDQASGEDMGGEMSSASVTIENFAFNPDGVTVPAGTTVTWTNQDDVPHTVTAGTPDAPDADLFASGNLGNGDTFSYTFDEAGTFDYFCENHNSMRGTVTVEG